MLFREAAPAANLITDSSDMFLFSYKIVLRASPGAASPLSFIAIRLTKHMGVFLALALVILRTL